MADYKYGIYLEAEIIAYEKYEKDFYSLSEKEKDEIWKQAEVNYFDRFNYDN